MAKVEVTNIEKHMNNETTLSIDVRTSTARVTIPIRIEDQGSLAKNETHAYSRALIFADELASALRLLLGS
jgi:hypothetical protein